MSTTQEQLKQAVTAKSFDPTTEQKNDALRAMARNLRCHTATILQANTLDLDAARDTLSPAMQERLTLTEAIINSMADGIDEVANLPDPVGVITSTIHRPNGLKIEKTASPMGVIAIIYESRPNVTSDAAALALKAGSVCVLRCGKEAYRSARAIVEGLHSGLDEVGFPTQCITLVSDITRQSALDLMTANGYVDLLIPRGGAGLISACVTQATVPVLETGTGICHVYIDKDADLDLGLDIVENAKASRPSVCNSAEVCVVHSDVAAQFLPRLKERLTTAREGKNLPPVALRADPQAMQYLNTTQATEQDFSTEFLDYILAVKVVHSLDEAIEHINAHSTGHSEAIISKNQESCTLFARKIDSAAVYLNASTRFTDGGEFGLGCEMGISTQKLHARGPLGLAELCTYRFVITGNGQIR